IAQHCGAEHEETVFSPHDMLALIEEVGGLLDEPLVDNSFLPTYALSRFARRSVGVALSGDGGDELFCGYPTFLADRAARWIGRLIYQHSKFYLADQNLVNVDRASMACGLEVRAPFLDHNLVDLACRIPVGLKLRGWTTKHILKRALQGVLPVSILLRRKQGF